MSDGLVSNVSLVLALVGADVGTAGIRLAGLAGLLAGAISMAAGEFVSMRAQTELLERELARERVEIEHNRPFEERELADSYHRRGIPLPVAMDFAAAAHVDPAVALEFHAREELGVDPGALGSARRAAIASFVAFAVGALLPVLPWFFVGGLRAVGLTAAVGAAAAIAVGVALASFTGRSRVRTALRQLLIAAGAAGATYLLGEAIGGGWSGA